MSLTASMWTSVSGLLVHGEKMNVIGNNISNVNTVGFKGDRMDFQDFMNQEVGTAAGIGQVGRGTSIGAIMKDWGEGSYERSSSATDMSITGNGMFMVKPKNSNLDFYTRAGNFRFDKDGYLTDPHQYVLQGWKIDNSARSLANATGSAGNVGSTIIGSGTPVDIRMDTFNCDPKATTNVSMAINLDSAKGNDKRVVEDNPFFSLLNSWNATPTSDGKIYPLGSQGTGYAFAQPIDVFDEGGQSHKLTVYFDRVTQTNVTNIDNLKDDQIIWEYIVTMDPVDDLRDFGDTPGAELPDKYKGLLMSGTMTFDKSGQMRDQTAYVPTSNNMGDMDTWLQAPISKNGFPMVAPNFAGRDGASSALDTSTNPPTANETASGYLVEMNFGLRSQTPSWDSQMPGAISGWSHTVTTGSLSERYKTVKDSNLKPVYYPKYNGANPATDLGYPTGPTGFPAWVNSSPGTGEVQGSDGYIYAQKKASQKPSEHEAISGNYVYEQEQKTVGTGTTVTGYVFENGGNKYVYDSATSEYYDYNDTGNPPTPISPAPDPKTLTAVADTTKPVATSEKVLSNVPKFRTDSSGEAIPATETSTYVGMGANAERLNTSSTSYTNNTGNNFYERSATQNGYTYGEFRYVSISESGVLSAHYSNGQTLELYQITLYDFPSKQNLRREGGNLFTETRDSGLPISGGANTGSFGVVQSNSLELSNVDLATEFVNMITTQKGFQANSKSITTVDTMLDTVIQMKR